MKPLRYWVYLSRELKEAGDQPFAMFEFQHSAMRYSEHTSCAIWDSELNEWV